MITILQNRNDTILEGVELKDWLTPWQILAGKINIFALTSIIEKINYIFPQQW